MVEGPGATRNGQKLKSVIGYNINTAASCNHDNQEKSKINQLCGCVISDAFSIGKEVFLMYKKRKEEEEEEEEAVIRYHFGMNGSLIIEREGINAGTAVPPWRKNQQCRLQLNLEHVVNKRRCSVKSYSSTISFLNSATQVRDKYLKLSKQDVCSPKFQEKTVLQTLQQPIHATTVISEAILNQDIFPGIGNIIKIESLHRSLIHPLAPVSSLSETKLRTLINDCRAFSMLWLRNGRTPNKFVYNQTTCGTCHNATISMQKVGGNLPRVTFWCRTCQLDLHSAIPGGDASVIHSVSNVTPCKRPVSSSAAQSTASVATPHLVSPNTSHPSYKTEFCPQHGASTVRLCRVKKELNQHRLFYTCNKKNCPYFTWADSRFPNCTCKKKSILRISKTAHSGGKWFFCCARGKQGGCGFFSWATPQHLQPFGNKLTPLL